jgi:hypothetical protein
MERAEQLEFQHLPPDAQYETLWRLALSGLTVEQVAEKTGWAPEKIRQRINKEPVRAVAPWKTARGAGLDRRASSGGDTAASRA